MGWVTGAIASSAWVALPVAMFGAFVRFPLKPLAVISLLSLPLFFALSHRPYIEHYACAITPLLVLFPAAGAAALLSASGGRRWLGMAYLGVYAAVGVSLVVAQGWREVAWVDNPYGGLTVSVQRAAAADDVAAEIPPLSRPEDEKALVKAVLAKRLLGRELEFRVDGKRCSVEIVLSGIDPPVNVSSPVTSIPAGPNSILLCR
jgi:hypothetical protein